MFVPECADLEDDREKYLFAYSIRMSLLPEGCIINGMSFSSCQLHRRHWVIRANDIIKSDFHGDAVIGKVRDVWLNSIFQRIFSTRSVRGTNEFLFNIGQHYRFPKI